MGGGHIQMEVGEFTEQQVGGRYINNREIARLI